MGKGQYWLGLLSVSVACNPILQVGESIEGAAAGQSTIEPRQANANTAGSAMIVAAQGGSNSST
ncbi:MAG TPA: hypothetical protein VIV60_06765, partial [Polyangiaceae bacterium]